MSQKRFFIGGVEIKEGKRRDYVLHLIDLVGGRFHRFSYREEVGEIVACLCSPGYGNSIREECRSEAEDGRIVRLPINRKNSQVNLDDQEDFAQALHEMNPEALEAAQELDCLLKDWQDLRYRHESHLAEQESYPEFFEELDELVPEEEPDQIWDVAVEAKALLPYLMGDHDFGSGPLFDFERDFTFKIEDIPEHLREKYRIISFETAKMAAIQFDQVKSVIDHALEDVGAKKATPKEVVPIGAMDCGPQDDALAFEGMKFMKARS
jgi:hypothetical protein